MNTNRFVATFAGIVVILAAAETGVFAIGTGGVSSFAVGGLDNCNKSDRTSKKSCPKLEGDQWVCVEKYQEAEAIDQQRLDVLTKSELVCTADGCKNTTFDVVQDASCLKVDPPTAVELPFGN